MKIYKKILAGFIGGALILAMLCGLAACGYNIFDNNIADTINTSVTIPEQYSISYEIEDATGVVRTMTKTVDADGNVYFSYGEKEKLFIKDGDLYQLYQKDSNEEYKATGAQAAYNQTFVDSETADFLTYAEQSKKQFIPGIKSNGEQEVVGRTCYVYGVALGSEKTGVSYSFYVDKETGICLGFESGKSAAGVDLGIDGAIFTCTEFITENIPSLAELLPKESLN